MGYYSGSDLTICHQEIHHALWFITPIGLVLMWVVIKGKRKLLYGMISSLTLSVRITQQSLIFKTARENLLTLIFSWSSFHHRIHYNGVQMRSMASQITGLSIVCSTVGTGADQRKHQSSASLAVTVTGEFPAQKASYGANVSIWWRLNDRVLSVNDTRGCCV